MLECLNGSLWLMHDSRVKGVEVNSQIDDLLTRAYKVVEI